MVVVRMQSEEEPEHDLGDGPSETQSRLRSSGNYGRDRRSGLPRVLNAILHLSQRTL